jgi:Lrp/AsnC family transcriptional regulator, leucine-responsive regulatory protein
MAYETDDKDVAILRVLGANSRLSFREIATKLGMHPNSVIERVRRMERAGIIEKYGLVVNSKLLGFRVTAVVQIDIKGRSDIAMRRISRLPFVREAYRTTGEYDGLVVVVCRDIDDLSRLVNDINGVDGVQRVNTKIALTEYRGGGDGSTGIF